MEEKINLINEKLNNPKIKEYLTGINKFHYLDFNTEVLGGLNAIFSQETYVLMMRLGIPIGVLEYVDSRGQIIPEDKVMDFKGKIKHIYNPINCMDDLRECYKKYRYPDFLVNFRCITKDKARHIAYCLEQCNNDMIFDLETMDAMQREIISSLPLKYEQAMKIFNKYFDKDIQTKYINDYRVSRERFYELSGLDELVSKDIYSKKMERRER